VAVWFKRRAALTVLEHLTGFNGTPLGLQLLALDVTVATCPVMSLTWDPLWPGGLSSEDLAVSAGSLLLKKLPCFKLGFRLLLHNIFFLNDGTKS
jgi:hypothetical protein